MKPSTYYMVSKLALTPIEKKNLLQKGKLTIERELRRMPESSLVYGRGNKTLFDKVDYRWIVGNTDKYIKDKKNVGRRKTDYPNNTPNVWSGSNWWDCERSLNEFKIDGIIVNGIKHKLNFIVTDHYVSKLKVDENYYRPILKYFIVLVKP